MKNTYHIKYRNDLLDFVSDYVDLNLKDRKITLRVDKSNVDNIFRSTTLEIMNKNMASVTFKLI